MLGTVFRIHGEFCASHPLEVVVTTITVIISLMSMGSALQLDGERVCGWNYECAKAQTLSKSDVIVLSFARCVALVYIYVQFRSLRRVGAKHLLGISGIFTIFSSFIFCIAFVKMFGNTLSGLYEALPFFLFLIDLSKASALAVFALSSTTREDIQQNIGKAMQLLGPAITLDAIVETLAIGLGTISGVKQLETMCSFGCLSVVANYVAFMTFYPACLALVLELSRDASSQDSIRQYKHLAEELRTKHEERMPNPVIQRVKIIMSAGLAIVHIHSHVVAAKMVPGTTDLSDDKEGMEYMEPEMSFLQFHLYRMFAVHADYGLTLMLGLVLLIKYIFVDRHYDLLDIKHSIELERSMSATEVGTQTDPQIQEYEEDNIRTSFSIGDEDDETGLPAVSKETKSCQTAGIQRLSPLRHLNSTEEPRSVQQCLALLNSEDDISCLTDLEVKQLVNGKHVPSYKLESMLGDYERGVSIRRQIVTDKIPTQDAMDKLPYSNYEYAYVDGACCENVVGYMPVPVGVAGPLVLDSHIYMVPMATTEGCLVASTNRGCSALRQAGGVHSMVIGDGMSRAPVVRLNCARRASEVKLWLENEDNFNIIREVFNSTSRFARLQKLQVIQAGRLLYVRFVARTGDAMGMNMVSKGTEKALHTVQENFTDLEILSLSGNMCTDKKSSAINWIEGRGKSVVCEAVVPAHIVKNTLKTSVQTLVDLNISKNLIGSAMAGSLGGYNAHAANIVTAIFIATGQDPAQTVASCNCITLLEATGENNEDLYISCTMPSVEVGTVGGGTILPPQAACLQMLGVHGSSLTDPGSNAQRLARIVCGTVLAGELSLLSALAAGHLVRSHLKHNRSSVCMGSFQGGMSVPVPSADKIPTTCSSQVHLLRSSLAKNFDKTSEPVLAATNPAHYNTNNNLSDNTNNNNSSSIDNGNASAKGTTSINPVIRSISPALTRSNQQSSHSAKLKGDQASSHGSFHLPRSPMSNLATRSPSLSPQTRPQSSCSTPSTVSPQLSSSLESVGRRWVVGASSSESSCSPSTQPSISPRITGSLEFDGNGSQCLSGTPPQSSNSPQVMGTSNQEYDEHQQSARTPPQSSSSPRPSRSAQSAGASPKSTRDNVRSRRSHNTGSEQSEIGNCIKHVS